MALRTLILSVAAGVLSFHALAAEKPSIWVYSDLSDPRQVRDHNHPINDPDDISALGSLLLTANRFNIEGIVVSSTNRANLVDPMPFINEAFIKPYQASLPGLNSTIGGYQEQINILRSSVTQVAEPKRFNPNKSYLDLAEFTTVAPVVKILQEKPLYVLNWGPLTESAILVKHLMETENQNALENLTIASHWTLSTVSQGSPEKPFHVANCRDDWKACMYLHELAKENKIKFIETGSSGQAGVVNGSVHYADYPGFEKSPLGQIFYHAKFYHQKPDQSDSATFWLLTEFGASLEDVKTDGTLTTAEEQQLIKLMKDDAVEIISELRKASDAAALSASPLNQNQIANLFTFIYQKKGKIEVYCPYESQLTLTDKNLKTLMSAQLTAGDHKFLESSWKGPVHAKFDCAGEIKSFTFHDLNL